MINKLKKILFKKEEINNSNEFSNQYLLNKMEQVFTEVLERESFDNRLLFDCDYLVILSPEVYNRLEVNSKIIIDGIIKRFYKVIKAKKGNKDYMPLSKEWCIQFIPRDFENSTDGNEPPLVEVMSSPVPLNWNNAKESDLQKVSINGKHSSFSNLNVNEYLLSNVNMVEKGKGCVKFNPNLVVEGEQSTESPTFSSEQTTTKPTGLAIIKFMENGQSLKFTMKKDTLIVGKSKPNEISSDTYLPIQTDDRGLKPNHFHIKYNAAERGFSIAVIAPTRVNEKSLTISRNTQELVWHPLTQESAILCGLTQFDFQAI